MEDQALAALKGSVSKYKKVVAFSFKFKFYCFYLCRLLSLHFFNLVLDNWLYLPKHIINFDLKKVLNEYFLDGA